MKKTIKVDAEVLQELDRHRATPEESYSNIIRRLVQRERQLMGKVHRAYTYGDPDAI